MSDEDLKALAAARLYSEDKPFQAIADSLEVSKSHAQVLVRRGIILLESKKNNPGEVTHETPGAHPQDLERADPFFSPQNIKLPEMYTLETTGIPKRIMLTPYALMIYDVWKGDGFEGDLSDFLEKSVIYLYKTRRPMDRTFDLR